jgi:hypothetical protein
MLRSLPYDPHTTGHTRYGRQGDIDRDADYI